MISITLPALKHITDVFNRRKKAIGLSGYTVREMIGQGGSANVYRLTGHTGSPDYVLRISAEQRSSYSQDIFNIREMDILQELKKDSLPHVVQYMDAFAVDVPGCPRYYCAVMKLLIPLNQYRLAGDGVEIAVRLGSDLLPLLQSFADREIIHRDIKPENIFYDGSFRNPTGFLLGDFGIAKRDTETSVTPTGTESTVSPEVRGLDRSLTKDRSRCDMYSLGIVMYRYLNEGIYPSNRERIDKMPPDTNPFPEPRFGSKRLKALVIKATSYLPEDRFESPQAMLRELQQCEEYALYIEQRSISGQFTFPTQSGTSMSFGFPKPSNMPQPGAPGSGGFSPAVNPYSPYSQQPSGVSTGGKQPVLKNAAGALLQNKPLLIGVGSSAAVLLIVVLILVSHLAGDVEIAGRKYHKNRDKYLFFSDTTLTEQDVSNIAQMKALTDLHFNGCRFESGAFKKLSGISSDLETLELKGCSGVNDLTPLSFMPSLKTLTLSNCLITDGQLSAELFQNFTSLRSIDLSDNAGLSDISLLTKVSGTLYEVNVSGTAVKDFTPLNGDSIEELKAENCGLTDRSLSKLPDASLKRLYLGHNQISDSSVLSQYAELTELDLSHNNITAISSLAGLVKLKSLDLSHNTIFFISDLSLCTELTSVHLSYCNLLELNGLEGAIHLKELRAAHNSIQSLDGIANCTLLNYVDLNGNAISDISVLSKSADKLNTVLLDNNRLDELSALKSATNLEVLSVDSNAIKSLSALKNCTKLKCFSASSNVISSFEPICDSQNLQYLYLSHNMINEVPAKFHYLSKLHEVDLSCNYLRTGELLAKTQSDFSVISLYANPIDTLSEIYSHKGTRLIITYNEGMDFGRLKDSFYCYDVVDCPLDKQVEIKNLLNGTVSYITPKEAAEKVSKNQVLCSAD